MKVLNGTDTNVDFSVLYLEYKAFPRNVHFTNPNTF